MQDDGRLNRNYKDGKSSINAFLDDYALTAMAFLDLYQASFDIKWLNKAEELIKYSIEHYFNDDTKMFNYASKLDPPLITKKSQFEDGVIPSSNSSIARSMFLLGTLTYNQEYLGMAEQILKNMIPQMSSNSYLSFYSNWYQLLLDHIVSPFEIVIMGEDAIQKRNELAKEYVGNSIFLGSKEEENLELLKDKLLEDVTMIYVCQNKTCKLPVTEVEQALDLIVH